MRFLLILLLSTLPVAAAEPPTVKVPFSLSGLPRSQVYRVVDSFEGYSYLGVKDVDSSPNPLGCSQDFVTYWHYFPQGGRKLESGTPGATGKPYATLTVLLDGNNFCSSFPPIEELALKLGNRIWRVRGDLVSPGGQVRVAANSGSLKGVSQALGVPEAAFLPYQILFSGGTQTKTRNEFYLPPDFIEALRKSPVANIPVRIYHPDEGISQFQIGDKTVKAWQELFQDYRPSRVEQSR